MPARRPSVAPHAAGDLARYGCSASRSASIVAGPMPLIWSSCSTEERPPCSSRKSTMFCAVTGPIPSILSSCSTVAVPRLIGPSPAAAAPRRAPPGDDDLLAVRQPRREVDRVLVRPGAQAAGALDRVGDPAPAGSR